MTTYNEDFLFSFDKNSRDTDPVVHQKVPSFPFSRVLSLAPLVACWNKVATWEQSVKAGFAKNIQEEVQKRPELLEPITDLSLIEKHRDLVDILMTMVFPPAFWERDYSAAFLPFQFQSFYATPSFRRLLLTADGAFKGQEVSLDAYSLAYGKLLRAYQLIVKQLYAMELEFEYPLIFATQDPETGLDRYFKLQFGLQFLEVKPIGALKPLTAEEKNYLRAHPTDFTTWMELIPPENFVFQGFMVANATDVTAQEVLSFLKRDLIEKESIFSQTNFLRLQERLRTLLKRSHVLLSVAAIQGEQVFVLQSGCKMEKCCIFADSQHYTFADFAGSIYEKVVTEERLLVIDDLTTYPVRSPVEERLISHGVRNMLVTQLYYQDALIGTLELVSPYPGDLTTIHAMQLREVLPLFSMAIKRGMEELNHRIQALIKEKCTAIHPAVEWRFRQAALRYIEQLSQGKAAEMEPIVFPDIYPLFGVSDIRGSSTQRNAAIQADLIEHLDLARAVIRLAHHFKPLPFLDELAYRIGKHIAELETGLGSGDEMTILDFLQREVEPLFSHLQEFSPDVQAKVRIYQEAMDPHRGILDRKRRAFEESVTLINETISAYLEAEEEKAQAMFPHYFEKHKSDGVEYGIYIGASLVADGKFDELYLKNLRLWQLMVMCGIAQRSAQIKAQLKVPLDTTHLVLVQSTPLAIRFRYDERQFDVDGAYNIRYEIMKKRIDKAMIKGRAERLTQPNKIAIVYSQSKEAMEYRQYIDYLQALGYLTKEIEDVDLEELQGIQGLKALRVTVNSQDAVREQSISPEAITEAVQAIAQVAT
jgi:hypothetical protein